MVVTAVLGLPGMAAAADPPTFEVTNIGFDAALGSEEPVAGRIAFGVSESDQGATDLNGDGDASDTVVHVFDPLAATLTNTLLATTTSARPTAVDGMVAFAVPEADQAGSDFNGDGDALDEVLHVFDIATSTSTNVGFAAEDLAAGGGLVAFTVDEAAQGATDLNGHGDASDHVVHVFDPVASTVTNTLLAVDPFASRTAFSGGVFGFPVDEAAQAGSDLNADGDILDNVFHTFDPATGTPTNVATAAFSATPAAGTFAFSVLESDQGATDLNGDGDVGAFEPVLHVYDPATATLTNVMVESGGETEILGVVSFSVDEAAQGATDLNADGDAVDLVQRGRRHPRRGRPRLGRRRRCQHQPDARRRWARAARCHRRRPRHAGGAGGVPGRHRPERRRRRHRLGAAPGGSGHRGGHQPHAGRAVPGGHLRRPARVPRRRGCPGRRPQRRR